MWVNSGCNPPFLTNPPFSLTPSLNKPLQRGGTNIQLIGIFNYYMAKYIISEQQYKLYQRTNNFPDSGTPVSENIVLTETPDSERIVWILTQALTKANDYLGDALKLVQFATQYPGATAEFPGLEERLNEISNDISCGANRGIDCGPEACDVMGQISLITQQLRYIKRDNL